MEGACVHTVVVASSPKLKARKTRKVDVIEKGSRAKGTEAKRCEAVRSNPKSYVLKHRVKAK